MKKASPKFSIITVCYNCAEDLEKTINSVKEQTFNNFEYIVIDGGSKDGSVDIIKKNSKYIDYWVSEPDKGIYNAMNKGAAVAKGEYLYFLNAGDVFTDVNVLMYIEDNIKDEDLIYGKIRVVSKTEDDSNVRSRTLNRWNIRLGTKVSQQAVFVRKRVFEQIGGLNEKYSIASDFDLLCSIIDSGFLYRKVDRVICNYDNTGISSNLKLSYNDTGKVIRDRYGVLNHVIYKIYTGVKLLLAIAINRKKI